MNFDDVTAKLTYISMGYLVVISSLLSRTNHVREEVHRTNSLFDYKIHILTLNKMYIFKNVFIFAISHKSLFCFSM